jgi:protein TonB
MPSATLVHSFPVPLGRRGTAAATVIALHVLLGAVLIAGLAVQLPPMVIPFMPSPVYVPPQPEPPVARTAPSGPDEWHFRLKPPDVSLEPPALPPVTAGGEVAPVPPDTGTSPTVPVVTSAARVLRADEPPYPAAARRLGEEGVVLVRVLVGADGRAEQVELAATSGSPRLDEAALRSVRHWLFRPAASGAGPVASWTTLRVVFRLTN